MALTQIITEDLKNAMLSRQSEVTGVLRMLKGSLKNAEIELGHELSDEEVIQVVRKESKKRQETASIYAKEGATERAETELAEVAIMEKYLPTPVEPAILEAFVTETIQSLGGTFEQKMRGEITKAALAKFGSQVDGRAVNVAIDSVTK